MVNKHPVIRAFALINQKRSHRVNYATGFGLVIAFFIILLLIRMTVNLSLLLRLAPAVFTGGFTGFLLVTFTLLLVYGCSVSALMLYRTQRDFLFHPRILTAPVNRRSILVAFLQAALLRAHVWGPVLLGLGALGLVVGLTGFNLFYVLYWLGFVTLFLSATAVIFLVAVKTRLQISDLEYLVSLLVVAFFFANPTLRVTQGWLGVYLLDTFNLRFTHFAWLLLVWLSTVLSLTAILVLLRLAHTLAARIRHRLQLTPALWSYFATVSPLVWLIIYLISLPILSSREVTVSTKTYTVSLLLAVSIMIFIKYKTSLEQRIGRAWSMQPQRMIWVKLLLVPFTTHTLLSLMPFLALLIPY